MGCKKKGTKKAAAAASGANANDKDKKALLDEIDREVSVMGSDAKATVLAKANKMHSILSKVLKSQDPSTKKNLQKLMVNLQKKIFNKSPSGVKELIMEGAKLLKASAKVK